MLLQRREKENWWKGEMAKCLRHFAVSFFILLTSFCHFAILQTYYGQWFIFSSYLPYLVSPFRYFALFSRDSRLYKRVWPSVRRSVRPSVRNAFFSIGQKWVETNKNEISDDEAGRDYTSHDLFRVYELVHWHSTSYNLLFDIVVD